MSGCNSCAGCIAASRIEWPLALVRPPPNHPHASRRPYSVTAACSLQPVKETQQKQLLLWRDLLLRYCRHHRLHMVPVTDADDCPLFHNRAINRE